jgi:trans-2,3-dihydro-3-hydroxyanthranilate isomerase
MTILKINNSKMKKLNYYLIDVFTNEQFGGNQLAVFPDGESVPEELMQKIARELNFSETTFVFPPKKSENDFKLRIFTPYKEIPLAGHPTIGSAFALLHNKSISKEKNGIVFEEGVGDIPVSFSKSDKNLIITMKQPLPTWGATIEKDKIAKILSLSTDDILDNTPIQVVSTGIPFLYIPVKDLKSIKNIKLRLDLYEEHLKNFETNNIFVFTTETERPTSFIHSRMFAPGIGISEDPATGSAQGPLGAYLVKYKIAKAGQTIISEQGFEMGRPSIIYIDIESNNDVISSVKVGGQSVLVGEGSIFIN